MKIAVYIVILLVLLSCAKAPDTLKSEKVEKAVAVLAVQSGHAMVNGKPASAGMDLHAGDVVSTSAGAKASIVFFDSSILRLDENTEITVKKIVAGDVRSVEIKQSAGQTWSRVLKIGGVREYKIETPNTAATVRGTGFAVRVSDGNTTVKVEDGKVHVASYENDQMVAEAVVSEDMQLTVSEEAPLEMELSAIEPDSWVSENEQYDDEFIQEVAQDYMETHPELVEELPEGMTEEQAEERFEELVEGEISEEQLAEVPAEEVEKAVEAPVEEAVESAPVEEVIEEPVQETVEKVVEEMPAEVIPEEAPVNFIPENIPEETA